MIKQALLNTWFERCTLSPVRFFFIGLRFLPEIIRRCSAQRQRVAQRVLRLFALAFGQPLPPGP